jgi:predicted ATP-grasp superfamily ATP-dependent carboligase
MPIDVPAIRCLSQHRKKIVKSNTLGLLPTFEIFDTADDKAELSKHLTLYNIPAPQTFLYKKGEICNESPLGFPVILKLFENIGGGAGVFIFNDNESLKNFFLNSQVNPGYLIQEYIEGYDIDCSVLCDQGNILAYTIQKGIMKGTNDFTPQLGVEFLFEEALYEVVEKLMVSLNWSGVAHIDMRYDVKDENFKVIEINPRFWGSLDASLIAGVNFPHFYCLSSKSIKFDVPKYDNVRFLNLVGLNKAFKKNKLFLFKFKFLLNNTPLKFFEKDPLPLIYSIIYKIKNDIKSIFS